MNNLNNDKWFTLTKHLAGHKNQYWVLRLWSKDKEFPDLVHTSKDYSYLVNLVNKRYRTYCKTRLA